MLPTADLRPLPSDFCSPTSSSALCPAPPLHLNRNPNPTLTRSPFSKSPLCRSPFLPTSDSLSSIVLLTKEDVLFTLSPLVQVPDFGLWTLDFGLWTHPSAFPSAPH